MPNDRTLGLALALSLLALPVAGAAAATTDLKSLGTFGSWSAYSYKEDGKPVCYTSSPAEKKEPGKPERKDALLFVTQRPTEKSIDVVSFLAGAKLKDGNGPKAVIDDDRSFALFAKDDSAWARDSDVDSALVGAMRRGLTLVLTAELDGGGRINDTYSLKGVTAALEAISKACNVKR